MTQPTLIPRPWAQNGSKTQIPETTTQFGRASWAAGFPQETALPLEGGGIPPNWLDFQGVLNALSSHAVYLQAGGHYAWDIGTDYPANAFVVGSDGALYKSLQESGPGTSAGPKNPASGANLAYWGTIPVPDELSVVDNSGKLSVDLANATPAALKKITQNIIDVGGGLGVIAATGKLNVDFSLMPTDKFEAMLKSIHVPIWIGENGVDRDFYVDGVNGEDSQNGGRGRSADLPWKTIGYATQTICQNYNINTRTVRINLVGGTYNITDTISLPLQQRTTGSIIIRPLDVDDTVDLVFSTATGGIMFSHSGGSWTLQDLNIHLIVEEQTSGAAVTPSILTSTDSNGGVMVAHCNVDFVDNSVAAVPGSKGTVSIRAFLSSGGKISFQNNPTVEDGQPVAAEFETSWSGNAVNASAYWLIANDNGAIFFRRSGASSPRGYTYNVSGAFTTFCATSQGGFFRVAASGPMPSFVGVDSPTGKRYAAETGSSITTGAANGTDVKTWFPGDSAGTVDADTYSWISPKPV